MTLIVTPDNPMPTGATPYELRTRDGLRLRALSVPPAGARRRGTVAIFQGRTEFIEKYFETVRDLSGRGFAVTSLDWRGQGLSQRLLRNPAKGHIRTFDEYERDLAAFLPWMREQGPLPYFALAHSMGGLITFRAAGRMDLGFSRIVLSAPLFGLGSGYEPVGAGRVIAKLAHGFGLGRLSIPTGKAAATEDQPFRDNALTSDPRRYARNARIVEAEPRLGLGSPTIAWVAASFRAMEDIGAVGFPERIDVPILAVAAGNDSVVSNEAIERIAGRLRVGRRIVVHGALHEILNEQDVLREQLLAAIDTFFAA